MLLWPLHEQFIYVHFITVRQLCIRNFWWNVSEFADRPDRHDGFHFLDIICRSLWKGCKNAWFNHFSSKMDTWFIVFQFLFIVPIWKTIIRHPDSEMVYVGWNHSSCPYRLQKHPLRTCFSNNWLRTKSTVFVQCSKNIPMLIWS